MTEEELITKIFYALMGKVDEVIYKGEISKTARDWLQENLPEVWNKYLWHIDISQYQARILGERIKILNAQLSPANLLQYLRNNQEWAWEECPGPDCVFGNLINKTTKTNCPVCNGTGKVIKEEYREVVKLLEAKD